MTRPALVLGGLIILAVVGVFALAVVAGRDEGRADPEASDVIAALGSALRALPGLGTDLEPADVTSDCFDPGPSTFEIAGPAVSCTVAVPEGIDRVRLGVVEGRCLVAVVDQPNVFDDSSDTADWEAGRRDLSLAGDGARIVLRASGGDEVCSLRLNPS